MTKEQLQEIIKSELVTQLQATNVQITEKIKEDLDERCKAITDETVNKTREMLKLENEPDAVKGKAGFENFSDFASAIYRAGRSGRTAEPRLVKLESDEKELFAELKAAGTPSMVESSGPDGGYLIPTEFRNQLLEVAVEKSNIMNMAVTIPMATNSVKIPYIAGFDRSSGTLHGGVQFKWLDEEAQKTATKPVIGQIDMNLHKIAGLAYMSDEILQDSPISMEPLLNRMFTDALAWQLDNVFLNGTGAGQPLGIINAPALIPIAKETDQTSTTLNRENVTKMYARQFNKGKATWFMNDDVFTQLTAMSLTVGAGGSAVFMPAGGISGQPFSTLYGRPIIFTEHCQTLGALGDVYFADFSQYLIGQKAGAGGGMKADTSIHLKFDYDQTAFRFVFRIDGQPWWISALTPRYSSDTLSPFVGLAARA